MTASHARPLYRRWWSSLGIATALLTVAGFAIIGSGSNGAAQASADSSTTLPVTWKGNLSQFPNAAWQQAWGVSGSGEFGMDRVRDVTDATAFGDQALSVAYGAGSAARSCTNCPSGGGAQFYANPPLSIGDITGSTKVALTYYVKFAKGFDFGRGGELPGLYGGVIGQESGGKHGQGWSTRAMWHTGASGATVGVQLYTPTNTGFGQALGAAAVPLKADGGWHHITETLNTTTQTFTMSYAGIPVFKGPIVGLAGIPAAGLMFSTFYGGADTSWGPKAATAVTFADFSIASNGTAAPVAPASGAPTSAPQPAPPPSAAPSAAPTATATDGTGGTGGTSTTSAHGGGDGKGHGHTHSPKPTPSTTTTTKPPTGGTGTTIDAYVTLYGAHDNTPANSTDIAYPVIHQEAGGTGTYADPITFATDKSELPVGTIIYYPYLSRYFIMEDDCTECDEDWTGKGPDGGPNFRHVDLWAGNSDDPDIENCEDNLTQDGQVEVIVNPPSNLSVVTTPIYSNGKCYKPSS